MAGKKRPRYSGELNTPLDVPLPPLAFEGPVTDETRSQYEAARTRQEMEHSGSLVEARGRKLRLLAEYFGIDPDAHKEEFWPKLALRLAYAYVPGFQFRNKGRRGRPKFWNEDRLEDLLTTVEELKLKFARSDRAACAWIVAKPEYASKRWFEPWKSKKEKKQRMETLEARLQDAKVWKRNLDKWVNDLDAIRSRPNSE